MTAAKGGRVRVVDDPWMTSAPGSGDGVVITLRPSVVCRLPMVGVVVRVAEGRASLACGGEAGGKRPGKDFGAAACWDVE